MHCWSSLHWVLHWAAEEMLERWARTNLELSGEQDQSRWHRSAELEEKVRFVSQRRTIPADGQEER